MNAIIKVSCVDSNKGINDALDKINSTIDVIRQYYKPKANITINTHSYRILDEEYDLITETMGHNRYTRPSIYEYLQLDEYEESLLENIEVYTDIIKKMHYDENAIKCLRNVLHYSRKADEAISYEDKILDYWIALETIFNNIEREKVIDDQKKRSKFDLMLEIIPNVLLNKYVYQYGWNSYNYIDHLVNSRHGAKKCLDLPEYLVDKAGFKFEIGKTIYLKNYITNILEIVQHVDREIIKEKLIETQKIYCDNTYAKTKLDNIHEMFQNELLMLYRLRNKIVHDAYCTGAFVEYSSIKLRYILSTILSVVFSKNSIANNALSIQEILVTNYVGYETIVTSIDNDKSINLLSILFND